MLSTIHCPSCRKQLRLPEDLIGMPVKCPMCQHEFPATENGGSVPLAVPPKEEIFQIRPDDEPAEPRPSRRRRDWDEDEEDDDDYHRPRRRSRRESARSLVAGPAIALMVVSGLGIGTAVLNTVVTLSQPREPAFRRGANPDPAFEAGRLLGNLVGLGVGICWSVFIFVGGIRMFQLRNFGIAMAASIVAMAPCNFCCLLGLPFGIWSLVVLNDSEVKDAFR